MRLILASRSPRRAELLTAAGIAFDVIPVEVDERIQPGESPAACVRRLALAKSREIARRNPGRPVLGADTLVVVGRRILGKPGSEPDARQMLKTLSGRTHQVLTGVALCLDGREACEAVSTKVRFLQLRPEEIEWYIASGEPRDKAGAYAVQGFASRFVERIEGSYSNVVGLPVATVCRMLREFGLLCP